MTVNDADTARLLVTCPDKPGIISAVSTFLYNHGANITDFDQHSSDAHGGTFFLRLEFQTPELQKSKVWNVGGHLAGIGLDFDKIAAGIFAVIWLESNLNMAGGEVGQGGVFF